MQILEKNRQEIETKASKMSDFLKMEYLEGCIRLKLGMDVNRFCYTQLSDLYANKSMFAEAAKYIALVAPLCVSSREKVQIRIKEVELLTKSGSLDRADSAMRAAVEEIPIEREQREFIKAVKDIYKKQAEILERTGKNSNALRIYEKLFALSDPTEKVELQKKLLILYERLGKVKEYLVLKKQLGLN